MSEISFPEVLSSYKKIVWPEIEKYLNTFTDFPDFCKIPSKYQSLLDLHRQMVCDYPLRQGKYLRPSLLMLTAESLGVPQSQALLTAAAMQLSEEWILLHDDIEDDSKERRGKPTLHQIYGKELAVNAGDNLQTIQWKILFDNFSILDKDIAARIINEFYLMFNRTYLGQTIDIKWNQDSNIVLTNEDIYLTLESKTGYYTIAGPMRLGGILAGISEDKLNHLYCFGVTLGRCFQIIDDILDITSDFSGLKKQQGNDIYENKKTIILIHLINHIQGDDKVKLGLILSKDRSHKTPEEVSYVIDLMQRYGSIDYARDVAADFAKEASNYFEKNLDFLKLEPFRSQLKAGIDFIINRQH